MNITEKTIKRKVTDFLRKYGISDMSSILVAYSGGPDSSALLWLLNDIRKSMGFDLNALYIDHGIRSQIEMAEECSSIESAAEGLDLPVYIKHILQCKITTESELTGRSIEDLAREYRYRLIEETKNELGASHIALGHTLDDQFETVIMRFFQGSGIHGLSGIPEKRDYFIRPLISTTKNELIEYINENTIPYVVDKTNLDTVYLRNKVRLKLIPAIAEIFPGYKRSLSVFSEKMDSIRLVLKEKSPALEVKLTIDGDTWFSRKEFIDKPVYQKVETLYKSWNMWKNKPFNRLPYKFLSTALAFNSGSNSDILTEGYSCQLIRHKEKIIWKRVVVVSSKKSYLRVITDGEQEIYPGMNLLLEQKKELSENTIWISREKITDTLIARSRISVDCIQLVEGLKPIKKLFNEWGVKPEERWKIPVIEDKTGIIAVLGSPFGFSNRIAMTFKNCSSDTIKIVISASYMEKYK